MTITIKKIPLVISTVISLVVIGALGYYIYALNTKSTSLEASINDWKGQNQTLQTRIDQQKQAKNSITTLLDSQLVQGDKISLQQQNTQDKATSYIQAVKAVCTAAIPAEADFKSSLDGLNSAIVDATKLAKDITKSVNSIYNNLNEDLPNSANPNGLRQ